jgi:alkylation response protein AidB-like acyl-CoA dehydrogenase
VVTNKSRSGALAGIGGMSPEDDAYQYGLSEWLALNLTDRYRSAARISAIGDENYLDVRLEWEQKLADAGWLSPSWPKEYGGRGGSQLQELIFVLEHGRARAPYLVGVPGRDLLAPTLLRHGTDAQKHRFLPPIMRAEQFWGQGYSEPDAGSDLAGLRTHAERHGDKWLINGQKTWTTLGSIAQWLFVLCRTDRQAPKHLGLSLLLVPVDQPGVQVRPIRHMGGREDFCELYFDNAVTEGDLMVGEEGDGWTVAMGSLATERISTSMPYQAVFEPQLDEVIEELRRLGRLNDPLVRQNLAAAWAGIRMNDWLNLRVLTGITRGDMPEAMTSVARLRWGEWHRHTTSQMIDMLGPSQMIDAAEQGNGWIQDSFLNAVAETVYGGTSQIQRTIIGERVLGLPREPVEKAGQ